MLTKKFTDFSADLLDTVRGVLGEAKKCKDCGCAKCECEDEGEEDDMEEGYVPTSDEPTEANKKTADKVRALLAKEKKPVKEESEQLDEYGLVIPRRDNLVSLKKHSFDNDFEDEMKKTRQTKKSVADAKKKYGVKEEVEQIDEWDISKMSHDKLKLHSTVPHGRYTRKEIQAEIKRRKSNGEYNSNYQAEEAEQIDEISGKTLSSYSAKVANYGPMKDAKTREKHEKGLYTAYKKMKAKDVKVPARMEEVEQIDELSTKTLDSYRSKARKEIIDADANDDTDTYNKRTKGYTKASKAVRKNFVKGVDESFEQIDELSKATMGRYINKAATKIGTQGITAGLKIASDENSKKNFKDMGKREKGIARAVNKLTKEEQDFIDSLNAMDLEEARGRPKKAGGKDFTIHPKTKEKLMHNNPEHMKKIELLQKHGVLQKPKTEAAQHIINQLQKAKTSMTGGATIHFTHGDSKHVSGTHAAKVLDKYAGMKPNEKEDFQKKIGHSHEQLMKHV